MTLDLGIKQAMLIREALKEHSKTTAQDDGREADILASKVGAAIAVEQIRWEKHIEAHLDDLAWRVWCADEAHKAFDESLCRDLCESIGKASEYDEYMKSGSDYHESEAYKLAEHACYELHIARQCRAMIWIVDPSEDEHSRWHTRRYDQYDCCDDILNNVNGLWDRIIAAINAAIGTSIDPTIVNVSPETTASEEKDCLRVLEGFCKYSPIDIYVEV